MPAELKPPGAEHGQVDAERWRRVWYSDDLATAAFLGALSAAPDESDLAPKLARQVVAIPARRVAGPVGG